MENLTPQQRAQLEVNQFKDFIATYNHVTQNCFEDCVRDFTSRRVTKEEIACCDHCVDKYVKMTQRLSLRLQEHYQLQNQVDPSQQQPLSR
ncbi:Mitochondrial import inner membrane translocase subunit Tim9 [Geodia barretti]|uniref:Mitochondrial import inner membrane translocase subunit n=1 Tax=Geodia barretti TaxID=519541 RepID=A0AA35RKK7_GEOBA|nr:Mitochondrial import inner membrane translocase subunit Tim9 [Geodia barretti]